MNFGLFQQAPQIAPTDFGAANAAGGMQGDAAQMAKQQALGIGASPADMQMRAGLMQAQKAAQVQAVSTRGNFGLAGAQKAAQTTQTGLQQNAINQGAMMRAQEQQAGMQQYLAAASQKRSADLQAAGLSQQEAIAQAGLEQQANAANQQMTGNIVGGLVGGASALASGGASLFSDERAKQEAYMQGAQDGARQIVPTIVQQWTRPEVMAAAQAHKTIPMGGGGQWTYGDKGYVPMMPGIPGQTQPTTPPPAAQPAAQPVAQSGGLPASSSTMSHQKSPYTMYDQSGQPVQPAPGADMQEASDARAKQPAPAGNNAAEAFLDTLQPRAFTWADQSVAPNPQAAQSPNLGVYAQDVEKSPWGQAIVHDDPATGYKQLDVKALISALAAGAGETHRRQQEHDQRLAALESVVRGRS